MDITIIDIKMQVIYIIHPLFHINIFVFHKSIHTYKMHASRNLIYLIRQRDDGNVDDGADRYVSFIFPSPWLNFPNF